MDLIQFRIHPSVGMARFGESTEWYFLGPEFPRFMQEQFPNLTHKSVARRHPSKAPGTPEPAKPADGVFRDAAGHVMPQGARFRIFAYLFNVGSREPYKVLEVTATDADIEWTVTVANRKTVRSATHKVDLNNPDPVTMTTNPVSAPSTCQRAGDVPNLAWVALESGTGRLHVIGNEGIDRDFRSTPPPAAERLFQFDWFDTAADGPVTAIVKPKSAFLSRFSGFKYLVPGQEDPQSLPASGAVDAVSAWVVVNMPDYVPDFGHFVSLWDLALAQSWKQVTDGAVHPVDGRHFLATKASEINDYAFYDYETHIHPVLTAFNDVAHTSGQARNASGKSDHFEIGLVIREKLTAPTNTTETALSTTPRAALRLQAAARMDTALTTRSFTHFNIVLTFDGNKPFETVHEIVLCKAIADDGTLTVTRGTAGTAADTWMLDTEFFAAPKGTYFEATLTADVVATDTLFKVESFAAHKMLQPSAVTGDLNEGAFFIAITDGTLVEWVKCTANDKRAGELKVVRGQLGTTARDWTHATATLIAGAGGHKSFDARKNMAKLARGARGAAHKRIQERLRLPHKLYRRSFNVLNGSGTTPFPRQYGRRFTVTVADGIDAVTGGIQVPPGSNVAPPGSLSGHWQRFSSFSGNACEGKDMGSGEAEVRNLDDFYWIASERDMPMLKDYAVTQLQYDQFDYWTTGKKPTDSKLRWAPLFGVLFDGTPIGAFLRAGGHTAEEYFNELAKRLPRYAPAMLDMAHSSKMLGGSFMPGIEVGREGGRPENWSLTHGATKYFPDIRFHPATGSTPHAPGMLTKDLAIPWFRDFISCDETYWPTSRPQIVYHEQGFAYLWLHGSVHDTVDYWRKVGFIRRSGDRFVEKERLLDIRD